MTVSEFLGRLFPIDLFKGLRVTGGYFFRRKETVQYPEQQPYLAPRYRGRIVLTRDPDGDERCVACNLCAVACPVDCIALQQGVREDGRWYPEFFRINFSRCIMCGMCEEACPTEPKSIWLTSKTYELASYDRWQNLYVDIDELQDWQVRPEYTDREVV